MAPAGNGESAHREEVCDPGGLSGRARADALGALIVRVLDPRRPPLPEISRRAAAVQRAISEADPRTAARLRHLDTPLAVRLAALAATLSTPQDEHERFALTVSVVVKGAPLGACVMGLVSAADLLPACAQYTIDQLEPGERGPDRQFIIRMQSVLSHLDEASGGRVGGRSKLRSILAQADLDPDENVTGAAIKRSMLAEARVARAAKSKQQGLAGSAAPMHDLGRVVKQLGLPASSFVERAEDTLKEMRSGEAG